MDTLLRETAPAAVDVASPRPVLALHALQGADAADVRAVARLHGELLAHSPVVLLGPEFMERFYYGRLPREGFIGACLARVDGEPAGFISFTTDASGFMTAALRRHWLRVAGILAGAIVRRPARLGAVREALTIMRGLPPSESAGGTGELLSFGVRPAYRGAAFVRRSGIDVGAKLLDAALVELRARGAVRVRAIVDQDNLAAKLFYRGAGWDLGNPNVPGWRVPTCEFVRSLGAPDRKGHA
jgi:ribosomal protein S18 acetylase RimI-like enzyme